MVLLCEKKVNKCLQKTQPKFLDGILSISLSLEQGFQSTSDVQGYQWCSDSNRENILMLYKFLC